MFGNKTVKKRLQTARMTVGGGSPKSASFASRINSNEVVVGELTYGHKVDTIDVNDYLIGGEYESVTSAGNNGFVELLKKHKARYSCCDEEEKSAVLDDVVKFWRSMEPKGRFLVHKEGDDLSWYEVVVEKAEEKAALIRRLKLELSVEMTEDERERARDEVKTTPVAKLRSLDDYDDSDLELSDNELEYWRGRALSNWPVDMELPSWDELCHRKPNKGGYFRFKRPALSVDCIKKKLNQIEDRVRLLNEEKNHWIGLLEKEKKRIAEVDPEEEAKRIAKDAKYSFYMTPGRII